jgi:energy-converting hydrogenase Eha subunit A
MIQDNPPRQLRRSESDPILPTEVIAAGEIAISRRFGKSVPAEGCAFAAPVR